MPRPEMAVWYDEMAVRLILWQNVQRFGFAVVAHKQNGACIKFHFIYALYASTGKKSDSALDITELCLLLHYTNRGLVYRNVI